MAVLAEGPAWALMERRHLATLPPERPPAGLDSPVTPLFLRNPEALIGLHW